MPEQSAMGHPGPPALPELESIAKRVLGIPTLETRSSDSLDFHDVAVWCVREALEQAYAAGRAGAGTPSESPAIACPRCRESDHDQLVWDDDEHITCQSCGARFDPSQH